MSYKIQTRYSCSIRNISALEVLRVIALYKSTFTYLLTYHVVVTHLNLVTHLTY